MTNFLIVGVAVFAIGLWIGLGAPGWPFKGGEGRHHQTKRSINPIAWGRTPGRERQTPRDVGERKIRLR